MIIESGEANEDLHASSLTPIDASLAGMLAHRAQAKKHGETSHERGIYSQKPTHTFDAIKSAIL